MPLPPLKMAQKAPAQTESSAEDGNGERGAIAREAWLERSRGVWNERRSWEDAQSAIGSARGRRGHTKYKAQALKSQTRAGSESRCCSRLPAPQTCPSHSPGSCKQPQMPRPGTASAGGQGCPQMPIPPGMWWHTQISLCACNAKKKQTKHSKPQPK